MKARNKSHMVCHGQYLLFLIVSPSLSSFLLSSGGENILINWWYNEINKFNFQIPDSVDGAGGGCFQAPRKCRCQSSLQSVRNECSIMCISDRNIERYEGMSIFVKEFSYRVYEEYVECYVQGPMKYVPWIQAHLKRYSRKKFVFKYNRTKNKRDTKQKPRKNLLMFFYWICRPLCWQCHMSVSYSVWHVSRLFLYVLIRCQSLTFFGHQPFNWVAGVLLSFFSSKSFVIDESCIASSNGPEGRPVGGKNEQKTTTVTRIPRPLSGSQRLSTWRLRHFESEANWMLIIKLCSDSFGIHSALCPI